jgi:broad specificity phosphatase PhoE
LGPGSRQIYLIRHGETAHNARRILQPPDVPLSEVGLDQARRLAERLANEGIRRIVSSDLARAAMTAQALEATTGAPLHYEPLLQERNFGELRGTAYADLTEDPFGPDYVPPGGESWESFRRRVERAWQVMQHYAAEAEGPVAVVTHGLVCRELVGVHLEVPEPLAAEAGSWANTSLTVADGPDPWRVLLLDSTTHLEDAKAGAPV